MARSNFRKTLCTLKRALFSSKVHETVRKLIIIISRSSLKLGQVGSKIRLQDEIVEKPYVHSRGYSFNSKFM